jgi:hypothetical protein
MARAESPTAEDEIADLVDRAVKNRVSTGIPSFCPIWLELVKTETVKALVVLSPNSFLVGAFNFLGTHFLVDLENLFRQDRAI